MSLSISEKKIRNRIIATPFCLEIIGYRTVFETADRVGHFFLCIGKWSMDEF